MQVAIALSLLVSEVAAPPFNNLVCTFSATPQLHVVKDDTLVAKVQELSQLQWDMNTNIQVQSQHAFCIAGVVVWVYIRKEGWGPCA